MNTITLVRTKPSDEYLKKWNATNTTDFVHLYINGVKVSDTLYRVSGFGAKLGQPYFTLLKQVESYYGDDIIKMVDKNNIQRKRHLANCSCIIDDNGVEKRVFSQFDYVYIYGVLYSLDKGIYNIETNELYCERYSNFTKTDNFMFVSNLYDKDESKRGVMKIDLKTGEYEVFN